MRDDQGENGSVETGIEETATSHAYASKGAAAAASVETDFDTTPVTARVSPALAPAPAAVETGFGELEETNAAVQQAAPTVNTVPNAGEPKGADDDVDARVAALLLNKSATNWNDIQAFMAAVVPWPLSSNDVGWVNLHWSFPDKNSTAVPKTNVLKGGKPYKDIADFIKDVAWRLQRPEGFKDMFFCTSMQRDHKTSPNGTRRAAKSGAAALALKSIWVDIDVKAGDPKHYHTEAEALKAILLFAKTVGLPDPSAIVRSGGGLHIYWISREALTPQEWLPYAQGLKTLLIANTILADTAITTDAARILRIPGTLNHKPKYPQPMPVELIDLSLKTYDFPSKLAFLHRSTGPTVAPTAAPGQHSIWADDPTVPPGARDTFKTGMAPEFKTALSMDEPGLDAGIDKFEDHKLDPLPIFQQCGFYREALKDGGKDYDQALWMFSILGATFMENGRAFAHEISKGHANYTPADTDAMYDRKVAERHDRGLGYPQCATIQGAGCKACKDCPHLAKGKSPLNLGRQEQSSTAGTAAEETATPHAEQSFVDPYAEFVGPEFPLDILPPTLANFVNAEHRAMGADPAAIAMAALTAVAGAINSETQVRMGEGWWEKPILWAVLVGQPSSMKSPIVDKAQKPLSEIDHERSKRFSQKHKKWLQDKKMDKTIVGPVRCRLECGWNSVWRVLQ